MADSGPRHPAPMLLVLALRWLAFGWLLVLALISGQVQAPVLASVAMAAVAGWTVWLTVAAVRRMTAVLALDLAIAVALTVVGGAVYPPHAMLTNHPSFVGAYPTAAVAAWAVNYRIRGGVLAGAVLGAALPVGYIANGDPPPSLSYLQVLAMVGWALSYVLLGGTVGAAAGQLERLRRQVGRGREHAARMAERQQIMARIHDEVLQQLGQLRGRLRELAEDTGGVAVAGIAEGIARQEAALRDLERPDPTSPAGQVCLRDRLAVVAAHQVELAVRLVASGPVWLPEDIAGEVEAAVRELLTNVAKHARARRVWLTVLQEDSHVTVSVRDDGVGFVPGPGSPEGLGLRLSVRARVDRLGGEVLIHSRPGSGTDVELHIPVGRS